MTLLKKGNIPSITGLRPFFGSHLGHISFIKSLPSIKEGEQKLLFVKILGGTSGYPFTIIIKNTTVSGTRSFAFSESIPIMFFSIKTSKRYSDPASFGWRYIPVLISDNDSISNF